MLRKIAVLAALALASTAALASGAYIIDTPGVTALVDEQGVDLISDDEIDALFAVREGSLYAAGAAGEYALYDASGARLSDARFAMIADLGGALVFRQGRYYGAMDEDGHVTVPPEWVQLVPDGEGGFLALKDSALDDQPDEVWRIVPGAEPVDTGSATASGLRTFHEGRMACMAPGGRWGWLDAQGRPAAGFDLDSAGDFIDGCAIACAGGRYGLMGLDGNWIAPPEYLWMGRGEEMVAALSDEGRAELYSSAGALLCSLKTAADQAEVVGAYLALREPDGARLYNRRGRCIHAASREALYFPGLDGQVIAADGHWGAACQRLIDPSGVAVGGFYQRILPLCGGRYAWVTMQGVEYYSDDLGAIQTSWDYDSVRYGLMDGAGNILLPDDYREILAAGQDRLLLIDDARVIFADTDGHPLRAWVIAGAAKTSSEAAG